MQAALSQFEENIERIKSLIGIYQILDKQTTQVIDSSDILRAAMVFTVSALDKFIHDAARMGMLETFQGKRLETDAYKRFQLSMNTLSALQRANTLDEKITLLDEEIFERHSWQSFQRPTRIADALRLVTSVKLWDALAEKIEITSKDLKAKLDVIIDKRDRIAHEADLKPSSFLLPEKRWRITYEMTQETISFIDKLVKAIYQILEEDLIN
jgi:hypothetical protein